MLGARSSNLSTVKANQNLVLSVTVLASSFFPVAIQSTNSNLEGKAKLNVKHYAMFRQTLKLIYSGRTYNEWVSVTALGQAAPFRPTLHLLSIQGC